LLSDKIKTEISSKEIINNFNLNDLLREWQKWHYLQNFLQNYQQKY
jgi:hypothetical protein